MIKVKTRKPFVPFTSGKVLKRFEEGNYNCVESELNIPCQYPVIAAGKYQTCSEKRGDILCVAACYVQKKERIAKKFLDIFFKAKNFYSNLFKINYPFKTQTLVEGISSGQAPPGIIFFSPPVSSQLRGKSLINKRAFQGFVHEIAHGYWGHTVKIPTSNEAWISEAMCQFSSSLCMYALDPGRNEAKRFYNTTLTLWKSQNSLINKGGILYFYNSLSGENPSDYLDSSRLLYARGPLIILSIKNKLQRDFGKNKGNIIFTKFLRILLKKYYFQNLYTIDIIETLNSLTRENWMPWFEDYVLGNKKLPAG